jgi:hypothetical protein
LRRFSVGIPRLSWAACIGGAAQQDGYRLIEDAGLHVAAIVDNPAYAFISDNAKGASRKSGVKSVSILATMRGET